MSLFESLQHSSIKSCLDFGCGSGILGVAALKYGIDRVVICDIDKSALDNCVQNLVLNFDGKNISNTTVVDRKRLEFNEKFDLVFANILQDALMSELPLLEQVVKKDGIIILSGLLNEQVDYISKNYSERGFEEIKRVSKGDWSAMEMIKV